MKKEKAIEKFLHRIETKANGAEMHLIFAQKDKEEIIAKRKQLHSNTEAKKRSRITAEISDAKKRFEMSSDIYKSNIKTISRAIEDIGRNDSKISKYIVNQSEVMARALNVAREFYGNSIPAFPESPAAVYV